VSLKIARNFCYQAIHSLTVLEFVRLVLGPVFVQFVLAASFHRDSPNRIEWDYWTVATDWLFVAVTRMPEKVLSTCSRTPFCFPLMAFR
jgi:hypothetical protein